MQESAREAEFLLISLKAPKMPNLRRRKSPARPAGSAPLRSTLAHAAWTVEDRVVWGTADFVRSHSGAVRGPFRRLIEAVKGPAQRSAWEVDRRVVWPIQQETSTWSRPARTGALAVAIVLAAAGAAAGVIASNPSSTSESAPVQAAAPISPAPVAAAPAASAIAGAKAEGPILHGAQPEFTPESDAGVNPTQGQAETGAGADSTTSSKTATSTTSPQSDSAKAAATGAIAGPEAVAVARRFAGAFVLYETGKTDANVKKVFGETATPDLEKALLRRPPRLPANVKVPQAKVLNIVPGPSNGAGSFMLSVSLLRVGVTSELKVEVQNFKHEARVADIKG